MFDKFKISLRRIIYVSLGTMDQMLGRKNCLVIYCYHDISEDPYVFNVRKKDFVCQLDYLSSWGEPVSLSDVAKYASGQKELPKRAFAISFDDGCSGILAVMEAVKTYGVKPTAFVLANGHGVIRNGIKPGVKLLSNGQIRSLVKVGWEIGSHTISHWKLTELPLGEVEKEAKNSKKILEKEIGIKVGSFAYPHGQYNKKIQKEVKDAGYKFAFSMDDRLFDSQADLFALPRVGVMGTHSFDEFKLLASPSVVLFRRLIKNTFLGRFI